MSDIQMVLARILEDYGMDDGRYCAASILEKYLVVPHSDIVGTEYAHRHVLDNSGECVHRAASVADARGMAGYDGDAVQRPILPWSVIPENGQS